MARRDLYRKVRRAMKGGFTGRADRRAYRAKVRRARQAVGKMLGGSL